MTNRLAYSAAQAILGYIRDNSDRLFVCTTAPSSYSAASTQPQKIVSGNVTANDWTLTQSSAGPNLVFGARTLMVEGSGSASHVAWARASGSTIMAVTEVCGTTILNSGANVTLGAWSTTIDSNVPGSAAAALIPVRAFPEAEGFGRLTIGGRGGTILHVTNLSASGTGSLAAALAASGPRIIVFDVSGTINFPTTSPVVTNPFFTIAGETAPAPGIQLTGYNINIQTHDFIIRHITFSGNAGTITNRDALQLRSDTTHPVYNGIIDHCTMRWGTDEVLDISTVNGQSAGPNFPHDITIQYCLIGQSDAAGSQIAAEGVNNITFYRCVWHNSVARQPRLHSFSQTEQINCISYNCGGADCQVGDQLATGAEPDFVTIKNNRYIAGPDTNTGAGLINWQAGPWATGSKLYYTGITQTGARTVFSNASTVNPIVATPPVNSGITDIQTADATFETYLLARVGARPNARDSATTLAINGITARTGAQGSFASYGSPVTYANNTSVFVPATNPSGDNDSDGYTNVEEQLFALANALSP